MIITNDEQALRVQCENVQSHEIASLIAILESELHQANRLGKNGIGLAAPQVGIAKHISIIRTGTINLNLVNAKLDHTYDPTIFRQEGCLSFPGRVEDTTRFQEIHLINNLVYPYSLIATGLLAVICQHELDHLNSVLFMDHKIIKPATVINKAKIKPNDPCPCGKGKKFKKCCGF